MRGLFNDLFLSGEEEDARVSIRLADAWPFQHGLSGPSVQVLRVSIRLADAWPFQLSMCRWRPLSPLRFNPPCGCVAFSTWIAGKGRLRIGGFQSALRMRGLFNKQLDALDGLARGVSIRLADAWPFQLLG